MLNAQSRQEGIVSVVTVQGSLKYENLPVLRGELKAILATQRPPLLVLNLEGVEFLDSSGISMLVAMHNVMVSKQGTLRLCGLNPHIAKLLKIVNLSSFFAIYPMEREALCETAS